MYIIDLSEVQLSDLKLVGGKNASLGEMYRHLIKKGVKIPNGFAITSKAYRFFIDKEKMVKEGI